MYFCVSQAPSRYYGLVCAVCFQDLLQQLESFLYAHTVLVVIIGSYTFESRQKVAVELPNIIEGLVEVQLGVLFLLQICLTDGTVIQPLDSAIVPTVWWRFIFQFAFYTYNKWQCFSFRYPKKSGLCNQPSPLVGGVWTQDYLETVQAVYTYLVQPVSSRVQPTSWGGYVNQFTIWIRVFTRIQFSLIQTLLM